MANIQSIAQHTPGPWEVVHRSGACVLKSVAHGDTIAQLESFGVLSKEAAANRALIAAAPELLAVVQEAIRINKARLILADGIDDSGQPFTEAQRIDAKAFLANRSAAWLHEAVAAIAKATGSAT